VVFGVWSYFYEVQEMSEKEYKYGSLATSRLTTYRTQDDGKISSRRVPVDSDTFKKRPAITSSNIEWIFIFLYWIILESSVWQASVGKRIMRIIVITKDGKRPTVFQCAVRNIKKIVSLFTLLVGFLMVLFTSKKQTLHDKISGLLVAKLPK